MTYHRKIFEKMLFFAGRKNGILLLFLNKQNERKKTMKQRNFKQNILRVLALCLCVVMCFTLGACGSENNTSELVIGDGEEYEGIGGLEGGEVTGNDAAGNKDNSGNNSNKGSAGDSGTSDKGNSNDAWLKDIPKELQGTTVTFAVWGDENAAEYAKVAKLFTKKTKINIKWVTYNEQNYVSTIVEQNAAGKGPDIVIMNQTFPNALEIVQELPAQFKLNDGFWDPRVTEAFSVKGKNFFVNSYKTPFANGGTFLFYNKEIFANNNIKSPQDYVNEGKWTWENIDKMLREVKQKGFDGGTLFPQYIYPVTGSAFISYDPKTATFKSGLSNSKDKANILAAFKYVSKLNKDGIISNNPVHRLATGQVAVAIVEHFGFKYNGWFNGMSPSALGVVNLPDKFNGQKANYISTAVRAYGIGKNAKNIEGAYYFLRYFLDIDNYDEANADIFLNKNMERFYKEDFLPKYKKGVMKVDYREQPLALAGYPWTTASPSSWAEVFGPYTPEEVDVALKARENIVANAAKLATEKIQKAVK